MGTETTTWSEFPNWGKAIVEQIIVSRNKKNPKEQAWRVRVPAGKLTIWVRRSFEVGKL